MRIKQLAVMAAAAGALAAAAPAYAACGAGVTAQPTTWNGAPSTAMTPVGWNDNDDIVGMWSVQFTLPGGAPFDFGYQQWHADHTEILNSGSRAPAIQNFCLGVWARVGSHFALNHYALSYDAASGKLNGRVNIREDVVLGPRGDTYSGTFLLTVVDPVKNTVLQRVPGTVTGHRVTVDSGLIP